MSSLSCQYSKYIFLPSGGAYYSPNSFIKIIKNDLSLLMVNSNLYNTEFEYIYQIIKNHVDIDIKNFNNLLLIDFYYLWFVIKSNFIKRRTNEVFKGSCSKCLKEQSIGLNFEKLIIRQNTKKEEINYLKIDGVEFRLRTVADNLSFPYITMNLKNITEKIIYYIWQQSISQKKLDYFLSLPLKDILKIYSNLSEYNKVFGIYDNLKFKCNECGAENTFNIFNDFAYCQFNLAGMVGETDKIEYYKNLLKILQTKIINTDDYYTIPYRDTSAFFGAFNQLDFSISQRFI